MTKEEKHLWYDLLKKLPKSFNRQKVIGNYIADAYMKSLGLKVLRYSNADINLRFDAIKQDILNNLV